MSFLSRFTGMLESGRARQARLWPCPSYSIDGEPHFLFIITPPYSGSTALAQLLNSCHGSCFLQSRAEGQWLIPGLCAADRWDPETCVNWTSVRAVWLRRVQLVRELVQDVDLVIEKSPPNMVRMQELVETFPRHTLMAFNRNPFAYCSSLTYRDHDPIAMGQDDRLKTFQLVAESWMARSRWIIKWIEEWDMIHFTYEDFCFDPSACIERLAEQIPILETVDTEKSIKVKDYQAQRIENQNDRQIERLNQEEIACISDVLNADPAVSEYFGYSSSIS